MCAMNAKTNNTPMRTKVVTTPKKYTAAVTSAMAGMNHMPPCYTAAPFAQGTRSYN
jgi:hypothetical protein